MVLFDLFVGGTQLKTIQYLPSCWVWSSFPCAFGRERGFVGYAFTFIGTFVLARNPGSPQKDIEPGIWCHKERASQPHNLHSPVMFLGCWSSMWENASHGGSLGGDYSVGSQREWTF